MPSTHKKNDQQGSGYLFTTFVGILGLVFASIIVTTLWYLPSYQRTGTANDYTIFYYALVVLFGLSCAAFLHGLMGSIQTLTATKFGVNFHFGGPIVSAILVVAGGWYLQSHILVPDQVAEPQRHIIHDVKAIGGSPVTISQKLPMILELESGNEWFEISVHGQFFGPELTDIKKLFGAEKVPVYVWVAEEYRQNRTFDKAVYWFQKKAGELEKDGYYTSRGYLGGNGSDNNQAGSGDVFSIRTCVPKKGIQFEERVGSMTSNELLKHCFFLTKPFYIVTRRPSGYQPNASEARK